jgi:hypothetical protein
MRDNHYVTDRQICLLGESVREIGVLVLVFVPLDMLLRTKGEAVSKYPSWFPGASHIAPQNLTVLFFLGLGVVLLYFGIVIEARAAEQEKGGNHNAISDGGV